jgi:FkbM family methyltransferase
LPLIPKLSKIAFVLASTDHGPLIVNRLDYTILERNEKGENVAGGVGLMLFEEGAHEMDGVQHILGLLNERARMMFPGDHLVYLDIGANIGTHTIPISKALGDRGIIFAFEPQERVFYALAGNVALNNCRNTRAMWMAVAERTGTIEVPLLEHWAPANFGGLSISPDVKQAPGQPVSFEPGRTQPVNCISIDDMGLDRCDLIKIDAEGMEPKIIAGARQTIEKHRPVIFAETGICGLKAFTDLLPGYRFQVSAGDAYTTAVHSDDPISLGMKDGEAA